MDHTDEDCLVVIILTHGKIIPFVNKKGDIFQTILSHDLVSYLEAKDKDYPIESVFKYFTNENCPTLKDKPKLFFIQACQGNKIDEGSWIKLLKEKTETDGSKFKLLKRETVLPQNDFLIVYASLPGFYSFRNKRDGSWFIRALCTELNNKKNLKGCDLMKILTFAIQTVAYDCESHSDNIEFDEKKQIPCVVSYLTKLLFFNDKKYYDD